MVSCRTVQGQKGVQKDKRNQCQTELIRGCLVPRATNFQKKHNESIMASPLPPPATNSAKKTQGGHCGAPSSSQKKHKARPIHIICALRLAVQEAGGCLTKKKAYLYNPGIMGIMPVAGGCLSRKRMS